MLPRSLLSIPLALFLFPHCVTYVMYLLDQIISSCFYHFCCDFVCSCTLIHWHALHSFLHLFKKYIFIFIFSNSSTLSWFMMSLSVYNSLQYSVQLSFISSLSIKIFPFLSFTAVVFDCHFLFTDLTS